MKWAHDRWFPLSLTLLLLVIMLSMHRWHDVFVLLVSIGGGFALARSSR